MRKLICIVCLFAFFLGIAAIHSKANENSLYTIKIKVKMANVRSKPSLNSSIITQLKEGTILQALEKEGKWHSVILPARGNSPERRAYVHQSIVDVISTETEAKSISGNVTEIPSQAMTKASSSEKSQKPVLEQSKAPPDRATEPKPYKRIYLSAEFNAGFQEESLSSTYIDTAYYETATTNLGYDVKKGTPFLAAVGFRITRSIGVEMGVDVSSRNLESTYSTSVPHPLIFNNPRTAGGNGSHSLSENTIFLNFVFGARFGRFGLDLFGGPAYIFSKAQIISDMSYSQSYPYDDISLSTSTKEVSMNVFGYNGGARILFYFSDTVALFTGARFIGGKASFDPETGLPFPEITLGGFRAGGGLKILF